MERIAELGLEHLADTDPVVRLQSGHERLDGVGGDAAAAAHRRDGAVGGPVVLESFAEAAVARGARHLQRVVVHP